MYDDQDEYQKWEFYYDLTKDLTANAGLAAMQLNQQQINQQQLNQQQPQTNPQQQINPGFQQNINNAMGNITSGFGNSTVTK